MKSKSNADFWETKLANADLLVEQLYEGGRRGNSSDDPLHSLLGVSNQGGFRYLGQGLSPHLVVLTTTMNDPDWPDSLDKESGLFTYFGDNKKPGTEIHDTPRFGNRLLRNMFNATHGGQNERLQVPPVFVFSNSGTWRDVIFLGLAVPGSESLHASEDLMATWKIKEEKRFLNYRVKFTILDVPLISRAWLEDIKKGNALSDNSPAVWEEWAKGGVYRPLKATRSIDYRSKNEQLPDNPVGMSMVQEIHKYFSPEPVGFEACAAKLAEIMIGNVASIDLTRPSRDGGRDALGKYRIGKGVSGILVDFALEAKCYGINHSVGVKETSRLISRLRHRQFGIIVTTSHVGTQAYQEINDDQHPIIVISARDIEGLLRDSDLSTVAEVKKWLVANFSRPERAQPGIV